MLFNTLHFTLINVPFIFYYFYYDQLMHNYVITVYITAVFCVIYTATRFDTIMSSSGS